MGPGAHGASGEAALPPVKIVGFRSWTLAGYGLRSINARLGTRWQLGTNRAECRRAEFLGREPDGAPRHDAPAHDCECGLHAWYVPNSAYARGPVATSVHGAIAAWGRIEAHWQGFRAEFAEPIALAYGADEPLAQVLRARMLADELELPFVALEELETVALERGARLPDALRPAPPAHVHPYARALALAPR